MIIWPKSILVLPKLELSKFVYKNLRFMDTKWNDLVNSCEINYCGSRVDMIYDRVFKSSETNYGITDESVLPFSFCIDPEYLREDLEVNINIVIVFNCGLFDLIFQKEFHMLVDIYEIIESKDNT